MRRSRWFGGRIVPHHRQQDRADRVWRVPRTNKAALFSIAARARIRLDWFVLRSLCCLRDHHACFSAFAACLRAIHHHCIVFRHHLAGCGASVAHFLTHHAHLHRHIRFAHHKVSAHLTHLSAIHHHLHRFGVGTAHLHALHNHFGTTAMAFHTGLNASLHIRCHHFYFLRDRNLWKADQRHPHSNLTLGPHLKQGKNRQQPFYFEWVISHIEARSSDAPFPLNSYRVQEMVA